MKPEEINTEENSLEPNYPINIGVSESSIPQNSPNYQESPSETEKIVRQRIDTLSRSFTKDVKGIDTIWEIFSFLSWFLFIGAKWDNFIFYHNYQNYYHPLLFNKNLLEFFTLIISLLGFLIYIKNIIYSKKESLYRGLFDDISRYHFVPFILYASLKIAHESFRRGLQTIQISRIISVSPSPNDGYDAFSIKAFYSFIMIFNILILASIIYVYYNTTMKCEWYITLTIKKGIYSILIMESWFGIFETIFFLRYYDCRNDAEKLLDLYKTGGIIFILFLGIGALAFAFFNKDIMILFVNFFIYLGMTIRFFGGEDPNEQEKDIINGNADGIIEVIMLVLNVVSIAFMIIIFKEKLVE